MTALPEKLVKKLNLRWPMSDLGPESLKSVELDRSWQYKESQRILDEHKRRSFRKFVPHSQFKSKLITKDTGQIIYDVNISVDQNSRRKILSVPEEAKKHLLFIGGSYTWGEGVGDENIFANIIQNQLKNYQVYVTAMPGFGPNDHLELLQNEGWLYQGISKKQGYAFYFFIEDHLYRLLPTMKKVAAKKYLRAKSRFELEGGELVHQGYFKDSFKYKMAEFFGKSHFLSYFNIDLLFNSKGKRENLFVRALLEIEKELQKKIGSQEVVLVILGKGSSGSKIKKKWMQLNKKALDYSSYDFKKATKDRHKFPVDRHPTKRLHWLFAELMMRDLKKMSID